MASPFDTIALTTDGTWDVAVINGSFSVLKSANAVAQDMSTAVRLFLGEYIYDADAGVPYSSIMGYTTSLPVLKADIADAAAMVPGTSNVVCYIESVTDRCVNGQVQAIVTTLTGTAAVAASTSSNVPPLVISVILTGSGGAPILTGGTGGPWLTGGP